MNSETTFGLAGMGFIVLIGVLVVVIIVSLIKTWQTKIQSTKETAYQEIAEELIDANQNTIKHQKKILQDLQDLNHRVKNVEKILREVE